jgi:hypothetical protein
MAAGKYHIDLDAAAASGDRPTARLVPSPDGTRTVGLVDRGPVGARQAAPQSPRRSRPISTPSRRDQRPRLPGRLQAQLIAWYAASLVVFVTAIWATSGAQSPFPSDQFSATCDQTFHTDPSGVVAFFIV